MKCQICGREYVSVGVHITRKHGVTPDEYREEFGLLKTAPLVDPTLSAHLSSMAKIRIALSDEQTRAETLDRLQSAPRVKAVMSKAGRELLRDRNLQRNDQYIAQQKASVLMILGANKTSISVRRAIGVCHQTILGMTERGEIVYDREEAERERLRLVAASIADRQRALIEKVLALYNSKLSLTQICQEVGIGLTTYKRWRADALVPNRKTYIKGRE